MFYFILIYFTLFHFIVLLKFQDAGMLKTGFPPDDPGEWAALKFSTAS
jgi:hypothetical protein